MDFFNFRSWIQKCWAEKGLEGIGNFQISPMQAFLPAYTQIKKNN